ncbi:MAG: hypothetical protein J8272_01100 ['Prunus persica' phytoplasma PP2]|nr:hypothetical protein ['Prunus persica' phytoplasma PP2]
MICGLVVLVKILMASWFCVCVCVCVCVKPLSPYNLDYRLYSLKTMIIRVEYI